VTVNNLEIPPNATIRQEYVKCDDPDCQNLHGPYLYAYWKQDKKLKKRYIGKNFQDGKTGFQDISAYCASKFGMIGLTESLAWEVPNYNIRVMGICPGEVDTNMQQSVDPDY
jgi:NAD(P)-dependent dehydrogenase (short-subunit alcohol dehydrogenase family)